MAPHVRPAVASITEDAIVDELLFIVGGRGGLTIEEILAELP